MVLDPGSSSESRVLMTKNLKKCTAKKTGYFFDKKKLQEKPLSLKKEHPAL